MKKARLLLFSALMVSVLLSGCGSDSSRQWRENAKKKAISFLEEKYGLTSLEVENVVSEKSYDLGHFRSSSLPETVVTVKSGTDTIHVYVNGGVEDQSETMDDYQYEQICDDLGDILEFYSSDPVLDYLVEYRPYEQKPSTDYMIHERYEVLPDLSVEAKAEALGQAFGGNLPISVQVYAAYVGDDINKLGNDTFSMTETSLPIGNLEVYALSFHSEEDYRNAVEPLDSYNISFAVNGLSMNGYAHITKKIGYQTGSDVVQYEQGETDEFLYVVENGNADQFELVKEPETVDGALTATYSVHNPGSKLILYYPESDPSDIRLVVNGMYGVKNQKKVPKEIKVSATSVCPKGYAPYNILFSTMEDVSFYFCKK